MTIQVMYTIGEVAYLAQTTQEVIMQLIENKKIAPILSNNKYLFNSEEIEKIKKNKDNGIVTIQRKTKPNLLIKVQKTEEKKQITNEQLWEKMCVIEEKLDKFLKIVSEIEKESEKN